MTPPIPSASNNGIPLSRLTRVGVGLGLDNWSFE